MPSSDPAARSTRSQVKDAMTQNTLDITPPATAEAGSGPAAQPSKRRRLRPHDLVWTALIGVAALALAEVSADRGWVSDLIVPSPSSVWDNLRSGVEQGLYWSPIVSTMTATLLGFGVALLSAIVIAGVLVTFPPLERIFMPYIVAFQTMPKIALAPIILLALGFGDTSKITIVAIVAFFPILVNSLQGLRLRSRDQAELMQSLGASKWQTFRIVRIPNSLPYIFAGIHIGLIFALLGAIVAEFVGASSGLGVLMLQQKAQFNIPGLWAVMAILMIIGAFLQQITAFAERRVAVWSGEHSAKASP